MSKQTREEVAFTERQMLAWNLCQEMADQTTARFDPSHRRLGEYITISREEGADAGEIAARVGQKLSWEVLDKKLLDCVAARYHLSRSMLELVDETSGNWAHDILGTWLDSKLIPHDKYVACLTRVIETAAQRGKVVFVGRGANFLLPRDRGLAVRLIAAEKYRVAQVMRERGLSEAEAKRRIAEVEQDRQGFAQRYFHHDLTDPHGYDLVISVSRIGPEVAADEIVEAWRRRNV